MLQHKKVFLKGVCGMSGKSSWEDENSAVWNGGQKGRKIRYSSKGMVETQGVSSSTSYFVQLTYY